MTKKTRSKAGNFPGNTLSSSFVDVRSRVLDAKGQQWFWVVDNSMRHYGEIDYERRVIRINHAMHREERGALIDTLFHEELHRLFPALGERAISSMTRLLLPTLSRQYRAWLYSRIRQR
jgi:hypothetical protein